VFTVEIGTFLLAHFYLRKDQVVTMKRSFAAAAAAIPVVTAGLIGGVSAPTQAAPLPVSCSHPWTDNDDGAGTVEALRANLRSGPNSNCSVVHTVPPGTGLDYDCYILKSDGTEWTHAQYTAYDKQGWIPSDSLAGGGSAELC
jgi:hypothetical protein